MSDGSNASRAPKSAPAGPRAFVLVWDLPLRICHWLLAISVLTAWFSANVFDSLHEISGYTALALLAFRLVWGVAGAPHSRFRNIAYPPRAVLHHLWQLAHGHSRRYLGHNPAGAAMTVALLVLIAISTISGWMQLTERFFGVTWVEVVHTVSSHLILALVVVHVLGVLLVGWLQRENLVRAMITGRKELRPADTAPGADRSTR